MYREIRKCTSLHSSLLPLLVYLVFQLGLQGKGAVPDWMYRETFWGGAILRGRVNSLQKLFYPWIKWSGETSLEGGTSGTTPKGGIFLCQWSSSSKLYSKLTGPSENSMQNQIICQLKGRVNQTLRFWRNYYSSDLFQIDEIWDVKEMSQWDSIFIMKPSKYEDRSFRTHSAHAWGRIIRPFNL